MYINNGLFTLRSATGWWALMPQAEAKLRLVYDPREVSRDGKYRILQWAKTGVCTRPTGQHASRWKMLMWAVGPKFLGVQHSSSMVIEFLSPSLVRRFTKVEVETLNAHGKLLSAASEQQYNRCEFTLDRHSRWDERYQLHLDTCDKRSRAHLFVNYGYGEGFTRQMAALVMEKLGSPFTPPQLEAFRELMETRFALRMHTTCNPRKDGEHSPFITVTRIQKCSNY